MRTKARPTRKPHTGTIAGAAAIAASASAPSGGACDVSAADSMPSAPSPTHPRQSEGKAALVTPSKGDDGQKSRLKNRKVGSDANDDDDSIFDEAASAPASRRILDEEDTAVDASGKRRRVLFADEDGDAAQSNNGDDGKLAIEQGMGGGPADPGGKSVEFDHAINYVNTIKKRFASQPEIYPKFLEILHKYQTKQRGMKEVLEDISLLFAEHADLLKEFAHFLPDAVQGQAKARLDVAARKAEERARQRLAIEVTENNTLIRVPAAVQKEPASMSESFELMRLILQNTKIVSAGSAGISGVTSNTPDIALRTNRAVEAMITHYNQFVDSNSVLDANAILSAFGEGMLEVVLKLLAANQNQTIVSIRLLKSPCAEKLSSATPPIPTPRRLPYWSRASARPHPSYTLLQMLGSIFKGSIFEDVVRSLTESQQRDAEKDTFVTAKMVYGVVDNIRNADEFGEGSVSSTSPLDIPGLVPTLRPYQDAAVRWMLKREGTLGSPAGNESDEWELCWYVIVESPADASRIVEAARSSHVMPLPEWRNGKHSSDERQLFCNPFAGWLAASYEEAKSCMMTEGGNDLKGGILAESMGLGKTVEVLACILANPSPQSFSQTPTPSFGEDEANTKDSNGVDESRSFSNSQVLSMERKSKGQKHDRRVMKPSEIHDAACICGRASSFADCLAWVVCEECGGAMHGHCAGFESDDELVSKTKESSSLGARVCTPDHCPCCAASSIGTTSTIESRATLIVTPPAILTQWQREISRHTYIHATGKPLKVAVYPGVRDLCNSSASCPHKKFAFVHPHELADSDIVLVTFQALMSDLGHSDDNPFAGFSAKGGSRLRSRRRYRVLPSPLMSIKWWRVCLDEAQRVEAPTAASARMARKLLTDRRWCVSGTPVGRGRLDDLYGLLLFLSFKPFDEKRWFSNSFVLSQGDALGRLSHLLKRVMWRSTKANRLVREQMGIPEQEEKKVLLKFSSVERYFYKRQYEETSATVKSWTTANSSDSLNHSLQKLRAACCHPQVGASGIGGRVTRRQQGSTTDRVLTMDQILERLIDDAKTKCEEDQRVATLHTIGLASLTKLKADLEKDNTLLEKSIDIFDEALALCDSNASPTEVIGAASLNGSIGFRFDQQIVNGGAATLDWQIMSSAENSEETNHEEWCSINFGSAKAISSVKVRPLCGVPAGLQKEHTGGWTVLNPKECVLQMSSAALGGVFVDVRSFSLPDDDDGSKQWKDISGFRAEKSKAWRIVIRSYHNGIPSRVSPELDPSRYYAGLEVQLFEPEITIDDLQRIHILHNKSLVLTELQQANGDQATKLREMEVEGSSIQDSYLRQAVAAHRQSMHRLVSVVNSREKCENELSALSQGSDRPWYEDVLAWGVLNGNEQDQQRLCEVVHHSLEVYYENEMRLQEAEQLQILIRRGKFPSYNSVDGLYAALAMRIQQGRNEVGLRDEEHQDECVRSVLSLSSTPSEGEMYENSHCRRCRKDWEQRGPVCRHCYLEDNLVKFQRLANDPEMNAVLKALGKYVKDQHSGARTQHKEYLKSLRRRSAAFFEVQDKVREEIESAKRVWDAHFNLLSDIDELNQCKRTMRLQHAGEDVSSLTKNEAAFIIDPSNVVAERMEHEVQQATAMRLLRNHQHSLRYLKNQRLERMSVKANAQSGGTQTSTANSTPETCALCLAPMDGERDVLPCGHSFHPSCIDRLLKRAGWASTIRCPSCRSTVRREDILLASNKSKDDGSRTSREIKGDWGTKVNQLIGDAMDAAQHGDRGIVFSQWDEMIGIVAEALNANGIHFIRPQSGKRFGEDIKRFRSSNVPMLLMNVKNGAEGLTLTEATHVFMLEPILNCGLDIQAINRIHRIGQTSKTYVHRYIVKDTIEEKIDAIRMERQENHFEDDLQEQKKHSIKGGGIDGGFDLSELHQLFG